MPSSSKTLTVAELLEMQAGDKENAAWINDDFEAIVSNVTVRQKATLATLSDPHNPRVSIDATFFGRQGVARFEGAVCHFSGSGMTRTEYNGKQQVTIGSKATVQIVGQASAPAATAQSAPRNSQPHRSAPAGGGSAASGAIFGATVGMALNQAIALVRERHGDYAAEHLMTVEGQKELHTLTSDILRMAALLEKGKLAPSVRERNQGEFPLDPDNREPEPQPEPTPPPTPPRNPAPAPSRAQQQDGPHGNGGQAFPTDGADDDDDVPF